MLAKNYWGVGIFDFFWGGGVPHKVRCLNKTLRCCVDISSANRTPLSLIESYQDDERCDDPAICLYLASIHALHGGVTTMQVAPGPSVFVGQPKLKQS